MSYVLVALVCLVLYDLAVRALRPVVLAFDLTLSWSNACEAASLGIKPGQVRTREELISLVYNIKEVREEISRQDEAMAALQEEAQWAC